jgi:6-phospho-3-hexuloisomerase
MEETLATITAEISDCLIRVSPESMEAALEELAAAPRIFVAGMGRSGLGIRAFAMRLMHLGKRAYVVGETTTPGIAAGDLLAIGSGSGRTEGLLAVARQARELGARVLLITIDPHSPMASLADCVVAIPAPSPRVQAECRVRPSIQPLGSLFEQCLLLLLDALVVHLLQREGVDPGEMWARHANLE